MKLKYDTRKHTLSIATGPVEVLIAVNPRYEKIDGQETMSWWDPINQRMFDIKKVTANEKDLFAWSDGPRRKFSLMPMTLEVYRETVVPEIPDARAFDTHVDLVKWFTKGIWEEIYGV